jgi:hypothetical protein
VLLHVAIHPFVPWGVVSILLVMSKRKSFIVTCPGCDGPFVAGRSMSMHLIWNPICRSSTILPAPTNLASSFQEEAAFVDTPPIHSTPPLPLFDSCFPVNDGSDDDNVPDLGTVSDAEEGLQDVIQFPQAFTTSQKHEANLIHIIHSIGAPNGAFHSIMAWAQKAATDGYDFQPSPSEYNPQINRLEALVGMKACRPAVTSVDMFCPDMEEDLLDVVVFDFPSMLASLFNCPVLNKLENLVVNPRNRYSKFEAPNGLLGEVNSGLWYDTAYKNLVHDVDKDFLCPIIFAMDKTVISEMAGLHVFVILFTSTIFNRQVCILSCNSLFLLLWCSSLFTCLFMYL